jgi:hypothetical protein
MIVVMTLMIVVPLTFIGFIGVLPKTGQFSSSLHPINKKKGNSLQFNEVSIRH